MALDDTDWPLFGWAADVRPALAAARANKNTAVLGTLVRVTGPAPRPAGTQMLFNGSQATGYFSGGCLEADVALHAEQVRIDGNPQRLIYGEGSPWIDIRLLCGGALEILLERIPPDDEAVGSLLQLKGCRELVAWKSDGLNRTAAVGLGDQPLSYDGSGYCMSFAPPWRLIVVGGDPIALAIASLGFTTGFEVTLVRPFGPSDPPPLPGVDYVRDSASTALSRLKADPWTAVVTATHDDDVDDEVILAALELDAGYLGVLGSGARASDRHRRLGRNGISSKAISSIHAPMGAVKSGKAPMEVAVSVIAEIMALRTERLTRPVA
jgi:xanthine dehydrogenase accessory factor